MEITDDYKFWVSLSHQKFDHKPNRETEVGKLRFSRIYTDVDGFAEALTKGYCYTPIFTNATFGMRDKTDRNFSYSSFVSLDIDHTDVDMNTMVDGLEYKPTISYTSCSNGLDGKYSYRLIYCFANKIEGCNEYYNYVNSLLEANKISTSAIDDRSFKASQYYNGNGCGNIDIKVSNIIYNKVDIIEYYKDYYNINNIGSNNNKSINVTNNTTPPTIISLNDTFVNKSFENDYWNMKMEDVLSKYVDVFPNIEHTPLPIVDDDTPYIVFPSDYIEIKRYWKKSNGRAIKIADGNGRRKKLFINGVIRRMINPSITFDNLLFNLLYELVYYISNFDAENVIDKKEIFYIARNVMKADLTRGEGLKGTNRRFMVNPKFCEKYGLNKRQVRNMACKMIHNEGIGELYDCSKTDKENLEVMKSHGLEISLVTLKRWRKQNGITKYKKNA
ncbi:hypothetical protein [Prevotella sp. FD3004]|uniref:hypothetical protein n=1 Tax=Prevotella sp. FD3004 TaxID=1408309 RepID=UPI00055BDC33|nr:hypothetical protein [Prevotella sp. FD3004]